MSLAEVILKQNKVNVQVSKFKFSNRSYKKLEGVHPEMVALAVLALKDSPYDFGITQGVRTKAQQADLYAQGRTKSGNKVTWTMNSRHLIQSDGFSHAFDYAVFIGGKLTWDIKYYDIVGKHIKAKAKELGINITWGGDFKRRKDKPHFQWEGL